MAPSVTPPPDAPRPLPRRAAPSPTPRAVRPPRLVPLDGLWMVLLAALTATLAALLPHSEHNGRVGAALAAVTVVLLYLLGWRARDRAAGIVAGLLAATSFVFLHHALVAPLDAAFALLTVAALFAFVAGSSLVALAFAGLATAVRPDGLLLGLVLLGLALAQGRRRAGLGILAFLLLAGGGWAARTGLGHGHLPALTVGARPWLVLWAVSGGTAFITWLLLPFLAELGEEPRRARWLPVALTTLAYFAVESVVRVGGREATVFGLLPLWFALAGGGLSRLLPALTGDFPRPWVRYGLATLAVGALVAMSVRAEWPSAFSKPAPVPHAAPVTAPPPAPIRPAAVVVPKPAPPVIVPHTAPAPATKPAPKAIVKAAPKAVAHPTYRPLSRYRYYRPLYRRRFARRFHR